MVAPISVSSSNPNEWAVFDLQFDPEQLMIADDGTLCDAIDGKIRVTTSSWDDAKVILPNQMLEVATIGKQVGLVRVDKPIAYLDIDDTGLVEAGYGPQL